MLGITLGDPQGIGPEVVVKAITSKELINIPVIIFGSYPILLRAVRQFTDGKYFINCINKNNLFSSRDSTINLFDIKTHNIKIHKKADGKSGRAAYEYIINAINWVNKGLIRGIVTAPISKEAFRLAGIKYKGHTEIFAKKTKTKSYAMSFFSKNLKVILATTHIPLKDIWKNLTKKRLEEVIILAHQILLEYGIKKPCLAVAGLNPHAGEEGLMGSEERKIIDPSVKRAKKKGIKISGPYPPDTVFLRAFKGEFDMVVSLYHDQGLIPMKLINFNECVNLTCGLPFIRTSPSHGTAFDIAWKGKADPRSMIEAVKLAYKFSKNKS